MLRMVLLGIWVIVATLAATYGAVLMNQAQNQPEEAPAEEPVTEEVKTEMTSIPMIRNGEVVGYVIIQMSFQADQAMLKALHLEPQPYLIDAAIRVIFSSTDIDFRRLRGSDIDRLTTEIARESNARIGHELVRAVLLQQLNFVAKDDIRTNWIKKGDG